MKRKQGRGRLSSIDALAGHGPEAEEIVAEALAALAERKLDQITILAAMNARLADLDPPVEPISKSAFNRHSMRFASQGRRLTEAREAAAAMAEKIDDLPEGDIGLLLGETIKTLINDVVVDEMLNGESPSIGLLKEASLSLSRLEAGRLANARTKVIASRDFVQKAAEAAANVAKEKGLSAETVQSIRAEILGVEQ